MNNNTKKIHCPQNSFPIKDNCLVVGGKLITELASETGQTPFYAYDKNVIEKRISLLKSKLPKEIQIHYAIKSNPMQKVVNFIQPKVDGLDVASSRELTIALNSGVNPKTVSFAGPGKQAAELSHAISAGITINIESANELETIAKLGKNQSKKPRVAVRVNPDFELKTSGMKMSGGPKQFGIDAEQVPTILSRIGQLDIDFIGFHIFSGSQNLLVDALKDAQTKTVQLACELSKAAPSTVKSLNIGGGFGIPYFPGEKPLDINPIGEHLNNLIPKIKKSMPETEIIIELGRYIVGEAGVYTCKIIDKKVSRGHTFLITDGGLHHHLAASGNFGQVVRKNYPVCIGNNINDDDKEIVSIVGPLCTPLDLLADRMELPKAEIGDLVVVFQSGAYGYTASPLNFLSHPEPKEVFI